MFQAKVSRTYSNQSTARIREISSNGRSRAERTIIIVTRPADGIDAAPTEANVAVIL